MTKTICARLTGFYLQTVFAQLRLQGGEWYRDSCDENKNMLGTSGRADNPGNSHLTLEKKMKAEFFLSEIDELIGLGSFPKESLQWLGVSESCYQKLRIVIKNFQ